MNVQKLFTREPGNERQFFQTIGVVVGVVAGLIVAAMIDGNAGEELDLGEDDAIS